MKTFYFIILLVCCGFVSCTRPTHVRQYFTSFDFGWDAMNMFLTTEQWFEEPANSGLSPYLQQERIRPDCSSFLNSALEQGGILLARQFCLLADCLDSTGFMENKPGERDDFIETLGKTACRMKNYHGCTRQPPSNVYFPSHNLRTCTSTNTIKALAKVHNLMECVIDMNLQ